jgi:hypothetical protein
MKTSGTVQFCKQEGTRINMKVNKKGHWPHFLGKYWAHPSKQRKHWPQPVHVLVEEIVARQACRLPCTLLLPCVLTYAISCWYTTREIKKSTRWERYQILRVHGFSTSSILSTCEWSQAFRTQILFCLVVCTSVTKGHRNRNLPLLQIVLCTPKANQVEVHWSFLPSSILHLVPAFKQPY